jgi:hypothetical protein
MIDQDKTSMSGQAINVGVYGATKAGKTRFLFQLLESWKRGDRLLPQSDQALAFLAQVRAEIEKHGESMPTAATAEGISVKVRRDPKERAWRFVFRDLRGELLTDEIPPDASIKRDGVVAKQVQESDGFLFFFDPASSENPADIDKHHQRELKRAALFVEYVLKVRENRHLPIIFVQTHLDRWENDAQVRPKAERWVNEVHAKLVDVYDSVLCRIHPKSIVDRHCIAFSVSSVGKTQEADKQLEKVLEQLNDLVAESRKHRRGQRNMGLYLLVAGVVALTVLVSVIWLLSSKGGSPSQSKKGEDRTTTAEMSEQEINAKLDELDRLLKAHPPGVQLPGVEEAKKINHHLRWLAQRIEPESGGLTGLSEKTQQRMRSALDSIGKRVHAKAECKDVPALTPVLTAYLEDLPDMIPTSPALAEAQARYWQLQRRQVIVLLSDILKRRIEVASPPIDTLGEVVSRLRGIEQEVARCKVFGTQPRQELVRGIQTAATFCEDRKNSKNCPATFRVASASYASDKKIDLAWRAISLQSADQSSVDYGLEPIRKGDTELSFKTKRPSYQITLGLGVPVTCSVSVHDGAEDKWRNLHEFELTTDRGPLAAIGLPLIRPDQPEVTKLLRWDGMELTLEFSGFPRVPPLLLDAAMSVKEREP